MSVDSFSEHLKQLSECVFGFMESLAISLCRRSRNCGLSLKLLQSALDVGVGWYRFEIAASLGDVLTDVLENSKTAIEVSPK